MKNRCIRTLGLDYRINRMIEMRAFTSCRSCYPVVLSESHSPQRGHCTWTVSGILANPVARTPYRVALQFVGAGQVATGGNKTSVHSVRFAAKTVCHRDCVRVGRPRLSAWSRLLLENLDHLGEVVDRGRCAVAVLDMKLTVVLVQREVVGIVRTLPIHLGDRLFVLSPFRPAYVGRHATTKRLASTRAQRAQKPMSGSRTVLSSFHRARRHRTALPTRPILATVTAEVAAKTS